jgi:NADH dehydrogenase/NADH:ubiquinone oxidoreductase subunit G
MSELAKLEGLLARVQRNRRPAPPSLEDMLLGIGSEDGEPPTVEAAAPPPSVGTIPAALSPAMPAEQARAVQQPAEEEPELEVVIDDEEDLATGDFDAVSAGGLEVVGPGDDVIDLGARADEDARERAAAETAAAERAAAERAAAEKAAAERAAAEKAAAERAAAERAAAEKAAAERAATERAAAEKAAAERADAERAAAAQAAAAQAAAAQAAAAQAAAAQAAAGGATEIAPTPPLAAAGVARIVRPMDSVAPSFGQLMRRTLALRPRD